MVQSATKLRATLVVFLLLALVCILTVSAKPSDNQITISFSNVPPKSISQYQSYHMDIIWKNPDQKKSCEGCFLFTVKNGGSSIDNAAITFVYKGVTIQPKSQCNSLQYLLPREAFAPSKTGSISVEVLYNKIGTYNWQVGIIKSQACAK